MINKFSIYCALIAILFSGIILGADFNFSYDDSNKDPITWGITGLTSRESSIPFISFCSNPSNDDSSNTENNERQIIILCQATKKDKNKSLTLQVPLVELTNKSEIFYPEDYDQTPNKKYFKLSFSQNTKSKILQEIGKLCITSNQQFADLESTNSTLERNYADLKSTNSTLKQDYSTLEQDYKKNIATTVSYKLYFTGASLLALVSILYILKVNFMLLRLAMVTR